MGTADGEHHPGEVLADRYRIKRLLGQGGFGRTYEAEPLTGGPPVAIKHLTLRNVGEWKVIELFAGDPANAGSGLRWRTVPNLNISYIRPLVYNDHAQPNSANDVYVANLVVARRPIGPIVPCN